MIMVEFADQGIGFMGIVSLCEALKMNTKITELRLYSKFLDFTPILCSYFDHAYFPDDQIGVDGAVALSEMLKPNTTLITIALDSLKHKFD